MCMCYMMVTTPIGHWKTHYDGNMSKKYLRTDCKGFLRMNLKGDVASNNMQSQDSKGDGQQAAHNVRPKP